MVPLTRYQGDFLCDSTGAVVGFVGINNKEYLFGGAVNTTATSAPTAYYPNVVAIGGGAINATSIGQTTAAAVKATNFQSATTDTSGTAGNGTISTPRGKAAFAAGASTVTITSTICTTTSTIIPFLNANDTTLTRILTIVPANGSFVVTGNANATAATNFEFIIIN